MPRNVAVQTYSSETGPAVNAFTIVTSDTQELDYVPKAIWVGTGGHINCIFDSAASNSNVYAVNIANIASGTKLEARIKKILTVGTTATDLVGLI